MPVARNLWGIIERRDHWVMRRMNWWRAPRWIRYWMIAATRMGDGWLWYGLGGMLLLFGGQSNGSRRWKRRGPRASQRRLRIQNHQEIERAFAALSA